MRVSVNKDDPGYREDSRLFTPSIDGRALTHCVTADTDLGEAHCFVRDEQGQLVIRADGELEIIILKGVVTLTGPAD